MKKSISVAMATYNGEKFLRKQLDSIYNQTIPPDEVVVSDDGSTDGTIAILEEYRISHGLKYSINNGEHGCNPNFYRAISLCTSDVIAISDQDDIWLPNKISVSFEKLSEIDDGKPSCVSSLCNHIDKDDNIISSSSDEQDTYGYTATLLTYGKHQNRSQGCSLMLNRALADTVLEKIRRYPEIVKIMFYDVFFSFSAATIGHKYNLGQKLMLYRHHSSNVLAKEGLKHAGIFSRLFNNDYFAFVPQQRLTTIPKMLTYYSQSEMNRDAYELCRKISKISHVSHYEGLKLILTIKELSFIRKSKILFGTIAMDVIKSILGRCNPTQ